MKELKEYLTESVFDDADSSVLIRSLDKFLEIADNRRGGTDLYRKYSVIENGILKIELPHDSFYINLYFNHLPTFIKEIEISCTTGVVADGYMFLDRYNGLPIPVRAKWRMISIETNAPKLDMVVNARAAIFIKSNTCKYVKISRPPQPDSPLSFGVYLKTPMLEDIQGLKDINIDSKSPWKLDVIDTKLGKTITRLRNKEIREGKNKYDVARKIADMFDLAGTNPTAIVFSSNFVRNGRGDRFSGTITVTDKPYFE